MKEILSFVLISVLRSHFAFCVLGSQICRYDHMQWCVQCDDPHFTKHICKGTMVRFSCARQYLIWNGRNCQQDSLLEVAFLSLKKDISFQASFSSWSFSFSVAKKTLERVISASDIPNQKCVGEGFGKGSCIAIHRTLLCSLYLAPAACPAGIAEYT